MSDTFGQDDGFYQGNYDDQYSQPAYNMGDNGQFGQDPQFAKFDYSEGYSGGESQYMTPNQGYTGTIMTPDTSSFASPTSGPDTYEDEPPLMEGFISLVVISKGDNSTCYTYFVELGINFDHITQKTMAVLNPFKQTDHTIMQDTDLAGPLVFCLAFGGSLMLSGKLHFGYIYGIGVVGCLAMYFLMNMMSMMGVAVGCIISVLGYCLLPMVILSFSAVLLSLQGIVGTVLTAVSVLWCSWSASKLFVSALSMHDQQLLVAYPCALVYGVFALLTVF